MTGVIISHQCIIYYVSVYMSVSVSVSVSPSPCLSLYACLSAFIYIYIYLLPRANTGGVFSQTNKTTSEGGTWGWVWTRGGGGGFFAQPVQSYDFISASPLHGAVVWALLRFQYSGNCIRALYYAWGWGRMGEGQDSSRMTTIPTHCGMSQISAETF